MGLPIEKLIIATNENDILDRFMKSGAYEKSVTHSDRAQGGIAADGSKAHEDGVKETMSPAMDILVSSNFERLLWYLAYGYAAGAKMDDEWNKKQAGQEVEAWLKELKANGGFKVPAEILKAAREDFDSERISDHQTLETIKDFYSPIIKNIDRESYVLDPHSAIGVASSLLSAQRKLSDNTYHIALATAHPAKFAHAVEKALEGEKDFDFKSVLPTEFIGLEKKEKRVQNVSKGAGWKEVRQIIQDEVKIELGKMVGMK